MAIISAGARRQLAELSSHYESAGRLEAVMNLQAAIKQAGRRIDDSPFAGLQAPRPYPQLAAPGLLWIKEGRYWVQYRPSFRPAAIVAVFYESANIPARSRSP